MKKKTIHKSRPVEIGISKGRHKSLPLHIYKDIAEIMAKAYKASHGVLEENKRLGIPTPFSLRGKIYYLMPDDRIVLKASRPARDNVSRRH